MKKGKLKSGLALFTAALLALGSVTALADEVAQTPDPAATASVTADPAQTPEPQTETAQIEDGTVRVLLTYPGTGLTQMDITLNGSYSVNGNAGFRFERGTKLHVFVSDGEPVLTYEGMTLHTGSGFSLTRHQTEGENGIRISGVDGLYEGDMYVSVVDGALRLVLHIYVEDYLKGVVPYEMSDSYPIEALKAQAVAARTYALKSRSASRDYDVYDNTYSQVFRGYNAAYTNAIAAVEATEGLVGTYKGALSECYYSASNGGQTDLYKNVFEDGADYGYLDMRNDPYDLENTQSRVKTASVPKQPGAVQQIPDGLNALLKTALGEQLSTMGYSDDAENITIADVLSVQPHTPKYDVPSRVFTKLRFKLRVMACRLAEAVPATAAETASATQAADAAVTPAPEQSAEPQPSQAVEAARLIDAAFTVDLDIFDAVEDALGLSISTSDNELITVSDAGDKFVIESRRFGHGLGMSQRGAEQMAGKYNWTYDQILAFYYPGMEFVTRGYVPSILPVIQEDVAATPRPTAEPTPRPTYIPVGDLPEGALYAEVSLANDSSTLNLRAEPSTTSQILAILMNGQPLIVLKENGDGWVQVQAGTLTGYVAAQYLKLI